MACFIRGSVLEACFESPDMSPKPGLIPSAVSVAWFFVPCILRFLVTMSNVQGRRRVYYLEDPIILILSRMCNALKLALETPNVYS